MGYMCLLLHMSSYFVLEAGHCEFCVVRCLYFVVFLQKELHFVMAGRKVIRRFI